jgi:streptomycin 6-kinase
VNGQTLTFNPQQLRGGEIFEAARSFSFTRSHDNVICIQGNILKVRAIFAEVSRSEKYALSRHAVLFQRKSAIIELRDKFRTSL